MPSAAPRVATLVLCTREGETLGQLPPFEALPTWWQDAEGLVRGVREEYGVEVTVLRLLEAARPGPPGGRVTYLAEVAAPPAADVPLSPYPGRLDEHSLRLPYAVPGGPGRDLAWARSVLDDAGFRQTGPAEQVRTWNLSSLWRIPVEGETLWLKCVPPFFSHEGTILAQLQDGPVPRMVAQAPGRVLMREVPGEDLHDAGLPTLLDLVSTLVDLQVAWAGREEALLGLGLPDWREEELSEAIESVVRRTAPRLPDEQVVVLDDLVAGLGQRFARLTDCGIPDSLVHGDFWTGNARGDGSRLVLLDWGDCGVGHPLLDQSAFLDRIAFDVVPVVREHWCRVWQRGVPGADPARAAQVLAPVAAARQAVIYQGFLDRIEPSEHAYHCDDPLTWLRRAAALAAEADGTHP